MQTKTTMAKRLDPIGNGRESDREIFNSVMKQWRQRIGYCSLFAAISAASSASLAEARSDTPKIAGASVGEEGPRRQKLNMLFRNRSLLKRQSEFRLPRANTSLLPAFAGNDDCPGTSIPSGTYTSGAPYSDSGDTTGANDTVTSLYYYYYYSNISAHGPDHVYSFTLTNRGANPEIRVSTSTSTYKPMVYITDGQYGRCPANTGNVANSWWAMALAASPGGSVTIDIQQMRNLPLGVPLYLFVDAPASDASGSGAYTVRMQDVTIGEPCSAANLIDCPGFFVSQQYSDFLNRRAEDSGFNAWLHFLNNCPAGDLVCRHERRLTTSAGFFGSPEFQLKGYFVFRFYRVAFSRLPQFSELVNGMWDVAGATPGEVYGRKAAFVNNFVQRNEFAGLYNVLSNTDYVGTLMNRYGLNSITTPDPAQPDGDAKVTLTQSQLVSRLDSSALTRAQVLRAIADSEEVFQSEYNRAFVAMQYYGYLRRMPEDSGYNMWLNYLNTHPGDYREMIRGFVDSREYRNRFGQP